LAGKKIANRLRTALRKVKPSIVQPKNEALMREKLDLDFRLDLYYYRVTPKLPKKVKIFSVDGELARIANTIRTKFTVCNAAWINLVRYFGQNLSPL
jgi:hypothetical protein